MGWLYLCAKVSSSVRLSVRLSDKFSISVLAVLHRIALPAVGTGVKIHEPPAAIALCVCMCGCPSVCAIVCWRKQHWKNVCNATQWAPEAAAFAAASPVTKQNRTHSNQHHPDNLQWQCGAATSIVDDDDDDSDLCCFCCRCASICPSVCACVPSNVRAGQGTHA